MEPDDFRPEDVDLDQGHCDKHQLTCLRVYQTLHDPDRVVFTDPQGSVSGMTLEVLGYSDSRGRVLRVVIVEEPEDGSLWVATAFPLRKRPLLRQYTERNQ
ncbi:hypothetical protein [Rhodococcus sp. SJ]|uniref:hypothetical protein n=1 Tax=Rhodococcus sp. SJ TaxID=3434112 RepID=UPI003D79FC59